MHNFFFKLNIATITLGAIFLMWFYVIDVKYNPVITFPDDVDPQNFQLTKEEYKRGEMVQGFTKFCKHRDSEGSTKWTLHNGTLTFFTQNEFRDIPSGCYPTEGEWIVFDIKRVPLEASTEGSHYFSATNYQKLWGDRIAENTFRTESFKVIK